ncbi:MAG: malto-oligosyltrehalose trehalohydrolase [Verrucomicrobia bacterium]|nr:malto-oligosyltrehalose trehalohydrolase [Verrucomicrobiota bacterium]
MMKHANQSSTNLGARYLGNGSCEFLVWAPDCKEVTVHIVSPNDKTIPLAPQDQGYFGATVENVRPGARYFYRLDGKSELPDPASCSQPEGVHKASEVADPEFPWADSAWFGLPLRDYILYELHPGTFTPEGTFDAIIPQLQGLRDLGVTAIELMPVSQFPGNRNWGYDGVYPFAVQDSYGGPAGLKRLVNACHQTGLSVVLDVVYNHLGPEGNYLGAYAPYFTERYKTPWGQALNFDGPYSDEVRRYFTENALYWQREFHIDALRLDAIHAIRDFSAVPFLEELADKTKEQAESLNRRFFLIAESDMNMARHILPKHLGGFGLDAQWSDDFHHSLHVLVTGEQTGYYQEFEGVLPLAKAWKQGYTFTGNHSSYRRHRHGSSPANTSLKQFVVCSQNHDQVGNRMFGDRISNGTSFEGQKLAAAAVLLSPCIPLLFMGEEYGDPAPFQYFISHSDPALVEAVRTGRRDEFAAFNWKGEVPDPQSEATFKACKLNKALAMNGSHKSLREFYRELIQMRKGLKPISHADKDTIEIQVAESDKTLCVRYLADHEEAFLLLCFSPSSAPVNVPLPSGRWNKRLDSADERWNGPGSQIPSEVVSDAGAKLHLSPMSAVLFTQTCKSKNPATVS